MKKLIILCAAALLVFGSTSCNKRCGGWYKNRNLGFQELDHQKPGDLAVVEFRIAAQFLEEQ